MGFPVNFDWKEYFILYPEIIHIKRGSYTQNWANIHWVQVGRKKNLPYKLPTNHPFKLLNLFNYLIKNKNLTFDDVFTTKNKMIENYVVNGKRDDLIQYNVILSDERDFTPINDLLNVFITHDFKLKVDERVFQLTEKQLMMISDIIKPNYFIVQNINRWNPSIVYKLLTNNKYIIFFANHYNISNYERFFEKAHLIFTDSDKLKGTNVFCNFIFNNIQKTKSDIEDIEEDKRNTKINIVGTSRYFSEYVDLLKNYGFINRPLDELSNEENIINMKLHFPFKDGGYVINTEKIINQGWIDTLSNIKKNNKFIDFCMANSQITENKSLFLPCVYHDNIIWKYPRTFEYDVGFVGTLSIKRKKILDELSQRGLKVNIIKAFDEERDKELSKCKLIVNINFNDNHKIFQYFRCSRIVFNKIPIISENVIECNELDINKEVLKFVSFTEYNNLVDKIISTLKNYDSYVSSLYKDFSYDKLRSMSQKHISDFKNTLLV